MRFIFGLALLGMLASGVNSYARLHGDDWLIDLGHDAVRIVSSLQSN